MTVPLARTRRLAPPGGRAPGTRRWASIEQSSRCWWQRMSGPAGPVALDAALGPATRPTASARASAVVRCSSAMSWPPPPPSFSGPSAQLLSPLAHHLDWPRTIAADAAAEGGVPWSVDSVGSRSYCYRATGLVVSSSTSTARRLRTVPTGSSLDADKIRRGGVLAASPPPLTPCRLTHG
jgi:hypothetical protein